MSCCCFLKRLLMTVVLVNVNVLQSDLPFTVIHSMSIRPLHHQCHAQRGDHVDCTLLSHRLFSIRAAAAAS